MYIFKKLIFLFIKCIKKLNNLVIVIDFRFNFRFYVLNIKNYRTNYGSEILLSCAID